MHHTLKFYGQHRQAALRFYMFWARWTRLPLLGRLVKWVANTYGHILHGAYLLTPAEAGALVDGAAYLALGPCTCRAVYKKCDHPVSAEIFLGASRHDLEEMLPADAREIGREEAKEILADSHRRGLIHSIIKCRGNFYAICNCCTCCCVPLRLSKQYGIGEALGRHRDIVAEFKEHQLSHHHA